MNLAELASMTETEIVEYMNEIIRASARDLHKRGRSRSYAYKTCKEMILICSMQAYHDVNEEDPDSNPEETMGYAEFTTKHLKEALNSELDILYGPKPPKRKKRK